MSFSADTDPASTLIRRAGDTAFSAYRHHPSAHPSKALRLLHSNRLSRRYVTSPERRYMWRTI